MNSVEINLGLFWSLFYKIELDIKWFWIIFEKFNLPSFAELPFAKFLDY